MARTGRLSTRIQASTKDIVDAARLAAGVPQQIRDSRVAKARSHTLVRLWESWLPILKEDGSHGLEVPEQGQVPSDEVLVAFASHYSAYARGVQHEEIRSSHLISQMRNFMNLLEELWNITIRKETRHIVTKACHGPLTEIHHLRTDPSDRPIADLDTIDAIISVIWSEAFMPNYQRDRIQYHALLLLHLFTAARGGTVLESNVHFGSNEGLSYCDVNLHIYPNPRDDEDIFLRGQLVLRYAKGNRGSNGRNFAYDISESDHLSDNLCRLLLLLGFLDDAWKDFPRIEDLKKLRGRIPAKGMPLRAKNAILPKPVFILESERHQRGEKAVTRLAWRDAWPRLREFGVIAGLKDNFTIGTIRRLCANAINRSSVTDAQRTAAMAHADKRSVYSSHYAAPQFNFQRVISSLREGQIDLPFRTMSQEMDVTAPRVPERATLFKKLNGDRQFMRNFHRQIALKDAIKTRRGTLAAAMNSAAGSAYVKLQRGALAQIREARKGLTKKARLDFFETTTHRLLQSRKVASSRPVEPVLPVVQVPLPGIKLLKSMRGIVFAEEDSQTLDTLKLLYSFCNLRTRLEAFLPGEEIVDDRCPQCLMDLQKLSGPHRRSHVHRCVASFKRSQASPSMKLVPRTHTLTASVRAARAIAKTRVCTLEACGRHKRRQIPKFRSKEAALRHIEEVHSFATTLTPRFPSYCYICLLWIDFRDWKAHAHQHFDDIFSETSRIPYQHNKPEFNRTLDGQVFVEKRSLVDHLAEPAHAFAHDFHIIVRKPGFCPFCVYNTSLPWHRRMHQFSLGTLFRDHVARHIMMLDATKKHECPDPQCRPRSIHAPHDLGTHLASVHLIPVYGSVSCSVKVIHGTSLALKTTFWVRKALVNFSENRTNKSSTGDPGKKPPKESDRRYRRKQAPSTESDVSSASESDACSESSRSAEEEAEEETLARRPRTRSTTVLERMSGQGEFHLAPRI